MFEPLTNNFNKPLTKQVKPRLRELSIAEQRNLGISANRRYAYRSIWGSFYICSCDKVAAKGRTPKGAYKNWESLREEIK